MSFAPANQLDTAMLAASFARVNRMFKFYWYPQKVAARVYSGLLCEILHLMYFDLAQYCVLFVKGRPCSAFRNVHWATTVTKGVVRLKRQ